MFDSHLHLDDERLAADRDEVLARARAAGVSGFLVAGVDPEGWRAEDALARAHRDVFVAYGLHPWIVAHAADDEVEPLLLALAASLQGGLTRPVALGEFGLDASVRVPKESLPRQEGAFRAQLAMARERDLPVLLHILRAHDAALAILKSDRPPRAGGVVHSYSGPAELVPRYLELGLHLSFAGPITYASARKTREAARAVPQDRLLVETDAPDQTPEPLRPGRNEPAFLVHIVRALSAVRGENEAELGAATGANARSLFGIKE
jgi:TatD DNase family protein